MKNLFIISFLLLALSSCIKVQDISTECAALPAPSLNTTNYTISSYGNNVRIYVNNYYSGKEFVVVSPKGDSTVFDYNYEYYIDIPVNSPLDTGRYFIYCRDYSRKCKSNNVYFNISGNIIQLNCSLYQDYFTLSNGSSDYSTGWGSGTTYSSYYSVSWSTVIGNVNTKFGLKYTGSGSQSYTISQSSPSNLGDTQCSITYATSSYTYTATSGDVLVTYDNNSSYYNLKLCNVIWRRSDNATYSGGKAWLRYYY